MNHRDAAEVLIDNGAYIDQKAGTFDTTPLTEAVWEDCFQAIHLNKKILYKNHVQKMVKTDLTFVKVFLLLLERGADIEATENRGRTPLSIAAVYGWPGFATSLIASGANIHAKDQGRCA